MGTNRSIFKILTDSVSVSILFDKPNEQNGCIDEARIDSALREKYANNEFDSEVGIDPGDKTYLAVMRRHLPCGAEVSENFYF